MKGQCIIWPDLKAAPVQYPAYGTGFCQGFKGLQSYSLLGLSDIPLLNKITKRSKNDNYNIRTFDITEVGVDSRDNFKLETWLNLGSFYVLKLGY